MTTLLDLLGVACFLALAYLVWPPLMLAVVGAVCLLVSRRLS